MANHTKTSFMRHIAGVSLGALALASAPAHAQAADDAGAEENVITVVGVTKQATDVQSVPTAIAVFSGDQLAARNVVRIQDIAEKTPGLLIRESPNNSSSINIGLRGQVQNDNLATVDPSVGTYVDGVYWARAYGLNADVLDVSNVQVLKGPQGTLFGRNTSAGALVIETNDPRLDEFSGSVEASYGRFNERMGTAVLNVPLGSIAAIRGAVKINKRDGTVRGYDAFKVLGGLTDVLTGKKYNNRDVLQGRVKLLAEPTPDIRVLLSGEWYDSKQDGSARFLSHMSPVVGPAGAALVAYDLSHIDRVSVSGTLDGITSFGPLTRSVYDKPFTNTNTQTYNAKLNFDLGGADFQFILGHRKVRSDSANDLDGTALISGNNEYTIRLQQYTAEAQVSGKAFNSALEYVIGASYLAEKGLDNSVGSTVSGANYTASSTFRSNIKNDAMGIYAQGMFHVTDRLDLVAGIRHSWDTRKNVADNIQFRSGGVNLTPASPGYCLITGITASADGHCYYAAKDNYQAWTYAAGINFHVNDDVMVYAKTGKGYRAGAQQLRTVGFDAASGVDTALASKPEVNFEHEIGLKSQFLDRMITLNVAGYYNTVKDFQSTVIKTTGGGARYTSVVNPADLRNYGVEADLIVKPTDGLTLFGSLSLNNEKYKNCANNRCPDFVRDIVQKQFSVGASYQRDLGFAELGLNVDYNWTGKVPLDASYRELDDIALALFGSTAPLANPAVAGALGALAIPDAEWRKIFMRRSVGILNARANLSFGDGKYEIYAFGRNLTNERFIQHTQYLFNVTTSSIRNDPRTYGVGAKITF